MFAVLLVYNVLDESVFQFNHVFKASPSWPYERGQQCSG